MRKVWLLMLALFVAGVQWPAAAQTRQDAEEVVYFYLNACESCDPLSEFAAEFFRHTGKNLSDYTFRAYNVYQQEGRAIYDRMTSELTGEQKRLPLLMFGGKTYAGQSSIDARLQRGLEPGPAAQSSLIYFVTTIACENCESAKRIVDALGDSVSLETEKGSVLSGVEVYRINLVEQPEMAMQLFERYAVPDSERIAPSVFFGETYLSGLAEIQTHLEELVKAGKAQNTPVLPPEAETERTPDVAALGGSAAAGLIAGLNPCALSMLLVFAGALLSIKRSSFRYGLLFLLGKLAAYLAIGLGASMLLTRLESGGLVRIIRIATTGVGAALIVMNVRDGVYAHRQRYGEIRNKLPGGLYARLRKMILQTVSHKAGVLGGTALAVGIIVAMGEFFCAGQLFVALLVANIQSGANKLPLFVYCVASMMPSVLLLIVVTRSQKTFMGSDWILKNMPMIKLLTSLALMAVLCYMWIA